MVDAISADKFKAWMEKQGLTNGGASRLFGVAESTVSAWRSTGVKRPMLHLVWYLMNTGMPADTLAEMLDVNLNPPPPPATMPQPSKYMRSMRDMAVGDALDMPRDASLSGFRSNSSSLGRKTNRKYRVRKHGDGYRCWRVA